MNGYSKDTVLQSLAVFGRYAGVSGGSDATTSITPQAPNLQVEADAVLRWLTLEKNHQWLMIFDNVDRDIHSDEDAQAYNVISFVPLADHGSILITTRLPSLGEIGISTKITKLTLNQALELLSNRSGLHVSSSGMIGIRSGGEGSS